jgi:hypothetical protein
MASAGENLGSRMTREGLLRAKALYAIVSAVVAAVALAAAGACRDFQDLKVVPQANDAPAPFSCNLVHPPGPFYLGAKPGENFDFLVAVENYDLGDRLEGGTPVYLTIGYDLDGVCTTGDGGYSCREPSWASAGHVHVDGPGGRDNSVGAELFSVNVALGAGPGAATMLTNSGHPMGGLEQAIRVSGYSGLTISTAVTVTYYAVTFHGDPDAGALYPRWNGSDAYDVIDRWLKPAEAGATPSIDEPLYQDTHAYVTEGPPGPDGASTRVLVSTLESLIAGPPPYHLRHVLMTAEIAWSNGAWVLRNGTFAGRIPIDELLYDVANVNDPTTHLPYCQDSPQYPFAKATACAYADINYSGPDGSGPDDPTQPCDGASWAWRFADSVPISLAGVRASQATPTTSCPPGKSPRDDRCGSP